ncbi:sensor domain-containing diguanylate cyclase [Luteimonas cellulosilyticus]|nr:GGDEF domain-containing protein [Luteimonas cellulosilyticus]
MELSPPRAMRGHTWAIAGCLLLLLALFVALLASTQLRPGEQVPVAVEPGPAPGADDLHEARLRFVLPPLEPRNGAPTRWAIWLPREPVESLQLRDDAGWRSEIGGFYGWRDDEGVLPTGYGFLLPADWSGPVELTLEARGSERGSFRPVLARAVDIRRIERSGVALAAAVYGSLLMLAALALALAYASRDRVFLGFFGFIIGLLLLLQGLNGHLYGLPGLRLFGVWGVQGLLALSLAYAASWLWLIEIYAFPSGAPRRFARPLRLGIGLLIALAAICLLNLSVLAVLMAVLTTLAWTVAGVGGLALLVDAGRRGVPLAWLLVAAGTVSLLAGIGSELASNGIIPELPMVHFGYQGAAVAFALTLGMGLIGRIGDYRDQRDRDRLARLDTERRMRREAARADLATELQTRLGTLDLGEIPSHGLRLLMDHLLPLVPTESCIAVVRGFQGRDYLLVEPADALVATRHELERRGLILRRLATGGIGLQQPVRSSAGAPVVAMEAVVPLPVRAPGWGALLLRRAGGEGFTTDEMSVIGELLRVTLMHIEQAMASIKLRRSAEMDALTGSMNRRTIDSWLQRAYVEGDRSGRTVSVLFVDLDHFKSVNDRFGHACGDDCLRHVAQALRSVLGDGDMLGRYGGEEFIVVLPGQDGAAARTVGELMRTAVENIDMHHDGHRVRLTVSIGIATRHGDEHAPAATIARADKALYAAKRQGRNCVQVAPAIFS